MQNIIFEDLNGEDIPSLQAIREYIIRDEKQGFGDITLARRNAIQNSKCLNFLSLLPLNYESDINKLKSEQDVLNELGNPRLIAKSIIDAAGQDDDHVQTEYYEEEQETDPEDMFGGNTHIFTMNSTKFKLGCLLSVIIFIFIMYLLFHVLSAAMVVLGPVIIVGLIVALIMNFTGR